MIAFQHNDGGRHASGYFGSAGDCVCRAIAIAANRPYAEVYGALAHGMATMRRTKKRPKAGIRSARNGIYTDTAWFKRYMRALGFVWVPVMKIGTGCTMHLTAEEIPPGRLVVMLSGHCTAVVNGVLHDTYDCSRDGTRCVYGYWELRE